MFLIVLVALLVVGGAYFLAKDQKLIGQETLTTKEVVVAGATSEFCANNPAIDLEWRVINEEASSVTYLPTTIYIEELDANGKTVSIQEANGGGSSTRTDSTDVLKCNKAHNIYIRSNQDNVTTLATPFKLSAADVLQDPVRIDLKTANFSALEVRVFDIIDDGYVDTNETLDNTTTDFEGVNESVYFISTTSDTAKTVAADDDYALKVELKTTTSDAKFGSKTLICVDNANDANSNDWDEPTVTFKGAGLKDMRSSLSSNDLLALVSYEYCYDLGIALHDSIETVRFDMDTGAGVNPDYDWSFKAVALGVYEDDKNPGTILSGVGFRTNAARTELATGTSHRFHFDVS